jgi:acyl-CoA synthetase (AMP-forming)/AMP-acid ligase II
VADLVNAPEVDPASLAPEPDGDAPAAVLFTSGATGPAKGVRYLHRQLAAQRDALAATYSITGDDRLVAAFAPFALYGPALGIPTALPACDVTKPGELTAAALDAACERIGATLAFASPAALANVVATAASGDHRGLAALRVVFSAGAPVPSETLRAVAVLAPNAELHTPYGMTEVLPVSDIELTEILAAEADDPTGGVCVGRPVPGAEVRITALGFDPEELPAELPTGATGEILVRAPWVSEGYLGLWAVERAARPGSGDWHRSGDVGHVDTSGRLWVEGRAVHVIHAAGGPVTSVPVERIVERELNIGRVAAVGVGPVGTQQLVIVVEQAGSSDGPADTETSDRVRRVVTDRLGLPVASVLTVSALPVDIRHNAKIDRTKVAAWATDLLAGRRVRSLG